MQRHRNAAGPCPSVLLLLLLICANPVHSLIDCGSCERGVYLTCPDSQSMQYTVTLLEAGTSLILKCVYDVSSLNFDLMNNCSFPNVRKVKIEQCPLFDVPLANVVTSIGVNASKVETLYWQFSHSVEKGLQKFHLSGLFSLLDLQMISNLFSSVPEQFLQPVLLLTKLYLSGNSFTSLPEDFLSYTPNLIFIDLGNNMIKEIPEIFLRTTPNLKMFNIQGNELTNIPPRLFENCKNLNTLLLSFNNILSLPNNLVQNLSQLNFVDFRRNHLSDISEDFFSGCSNLSFAYFMYNNLTSIPSKLFEGTSIRVLNLGYNSLNNVSFALQNLNTLENVTLHKNFLTELESEMFSGTSNIVLLDVQHNRIGSLGEGVFDNLRNMAVAIMNDNLISELPLGLFKNCDSLIRLFLQHNMLNSVPPDTFPYASYITKLDLSFNNISFPDYYINPLNSLINIEELYLSNNRITSIFPDALNVFARLRILDLQNNMIAYVGDSDLMFISVNVTLLLQGNNVTIDSTPFLEYANANSIVYVSLASNPINCDCRLYSFLKYSQLVPPFSMENRFSIIVQDANETFCSLPNSYVGKSLMEVQPNLLVCPVNCSVECSCNVRPSDKYVLMDCSNLGLSNIPTFHDTFKKFSRWNLHLDLSRNTYEDVSFLGNSEFSKLVHLNLSHNLINSLNKTYLSTSLRVLNIRFNNFSNMDEELVEFLNNSAMTLYLGGNPWICNCNLQGFHNFIRDSYELVVDRQQVLCSDGQAPIDELTAEQICPVFVRPTVLASVVVGSVLLLLTAVLVTAMWYRHKEIVKVWLYSNNLCLWAVTEQEIDANKKYDAFISYSYKDEAFVNDHLVQELEMGDPPYKLCLHYRDWIPGEYIQDQILRSVRDSRRTIVVLSKNFLESVWGQLEFKAANTQAFKDRTNRIIVVVLEDVPNELLDGELKNYIATNTYLKWGDVRFWERLKYAMPHSKYVRRRHAKVGNKLEMVKPAPKYATKTMDD